MSFGLQMFDETGKLTADPLTYSMRTVYSTYVAGGAFSGSRYYYVAGSSNCLAFLAPAANNQYQLNIPALSRSGDTLIATNNSKLANVIASYLYVVDIS